MQSDWQANEPWRTVAQNATHCRRGSRAFSASMVGHEHFVGECSARYMMIARNGVVRRLAMEARMSDTTGARAEDALAAQDALVIG